MRPGPDKNSPAGSYLFFLLRLPYMGSLSFFLRAWPHKSGCAKFGTQGGPHHLEKLVVV